ncbi:unnamed protein product [Mucor hiemalis]
MSTSFANLLRSSRLASYDRSVGQVYTKSMKNKRSEWGLKRDLPSVIRTKYVAIGALDTAEHQTPWESGESKVLFVKRWKENFPNSEKPTPRAEEEQHNIASMTPAEFQRFLRASEKKSDAFQAKLQKKELVPEQVYDFLDVNFSDAAETKVNGVVGPTYSEHHVGWDYPVQGRILNTDCHGHAVGIGGVVALLPKRTAVGLRNNGDRRVQTFFVSKAEMNESGKPKVEVTLQSKGATSSIPLLSNYEDYEPFEFPVDSYDNCGRSNNNNNSNNNRRARNNNNNNINMSADDVMKMRSQRRAQGPESEDNIKPNPEHTELMARIAGLLDNTKDKH